MMRENWWSVPLEQLTPDELSYLLTNLSSKLWRLDNLYYIKDKYSNISIMKLNDSQLKVLTKYKHNKKIILKSRQQGISTFWLVSYFDDGLFQELLAIGLMAQGVDEASTLLERTKFLWDKLDPDIKAYLNRSLEKEN